VAVAEIGILGGSGFYEFLDDVEEVEVETPYGAPSAPVEVATVSARASLSYPGTDESMSCRRPRSITAPTSGRCVSWGLAG
jgi:purine nucleoside phosphorylase